MLILGYVEKPSGATKTPVFLSQRVNESTSQQVNKATGQQVNGATGQQVSFSFRSIGISIALVDTCLRHVIKGARKWRTHYLSYAGFAPITRPNIQQNPLIIITLTIGRNTPGYSGYFKRPPTSEMEVR